jgi:hypothetical protein
MDQATFVADGSKEGPIMTLGTADHANDATAALAWAYAEDEPLLDHHLEELVAMMRRRALIQGGEEAGVDS